MAYLRLMMPPPKCSCTPSVVLGAHHSMARAQAAASEGEPWGPARPSVSAKSWLTYVQPAKQPDVAL